MRLEIEREALKKEKDDASRQRLETIEKEIVDLREEVDTLRARYEREKAENPGVEISPNSHEDEEQRDGNGGNAQRADRVPTAPFRP